MKFRPLHDRVLIEVLDSEEKTAGGIIIPDTAKEKPQEGKVVAIGSGARTEDGKVIPMDVKVGDLVLFGKWSGTEVKIFSVKFSSIFNSNKKNFTFIDGLGALDIRTNLLFNLFKFFNTLMASGYNLTPL